MRIGIVTLPLSTNYGGNLQAYALQTVLKRLGHDVLVLNKPPYFELPSFKSVLHRYIHNIFSSNKVDVYLEKHLNEKIDESLNRNTELLEKTGEFTNLFIQQKKIKFFSELQCGDFDVFFVGSDQCWRPIYANPIQGYYLDFAKSWNVKRIAYAASFGVDKWEYSENDTLKCKKNAKKFDAVSVREDSGVGLCKSYLDIDAKHVLDPTMLLSKEDYIEIVNAFKKKCVPQPINDLFCYILDITEQKKSLILSVSKVWNTVPTLCSEFYVEEWLNAFYNARIVLVDSFHGVVFSIIFNKPFWVIGNAKRGNARFSSLLKLFGLEDRLIDPENYASVNWKAEIDWAKVNETLEAQKKKSMAFIVDSLEK